MGQTCGCDHGGCFNEQRGSVCTSSSSDARLGMVGGHTVLSANAGDGNVQTTVREDGVLCIGQSHSSSGVLRYANGDVYNGEWRDLSATGWGRIVRVDGSSYEGQWLRDAAHGEGVETFVDGCLYRGSYRQGMKQGHGNIQWSNGTEFIGQFRTNGFDGEGQYKWNDGREYSGQWAKNQFHGHGKMSWPDGRRYEGQYAHDRKEGTGTFVWGDGRRFTGSWKDGKQHGIGVFTDLHGIPARTGEWVLGKRVRWIDDAGEVAAAHAAAATANELANDSAESSNLPAVAKEVPKGPVLSEIAEPPHASATA